MNRLISIKFEYQQFTKNHIMYRYESMKGSTQLGSEVYIIDFTGKGLSCANVRRLREYVTINRLLTRFW